MLHKFATNALSLMLRTYKHHRHVSFAGDYPSSAGLSTEWLGQRHAYDAAISRGQDEQRVEVGQLVTNPFGPFRIWLPALGHASSHPDRKRFFRIIHVFIVLVATVSLRAARDVLAPISA